MKKINLKKLQVQSFVTNMDKDTSQTVKGGLDTYFDTACRYSVGGPNSFCNTYVSFCDSDFSHNNSACC